MNSTSLPHNMRWMGVFPLFFFVWKIFYYIDSQQSLEHLLWFCNLGCLFLAMAWFVSSARLLFLSIGWLSFGTPLWFYDSFLSNDFSVSSFFTHLGGLFFAFWALRYLKVDKNSYRFHLGLTFVVFVILRATTSYSNNVNLSQHVWKGWETMFPSYVAYIAFLFACIAVWFWFLEKCVLKLQRRMQSFRIVED